MRPRGKRRGAKETETEELGRKEEERKRWMLKSR